MDENSLGISLPLQVPASPSSAERGECVPGGPEAALSHVCQKEWAARVTCPRLCPCLRASDPSAQNLPCASWGGRLLESHSPESEDGVFPSTTVFGKILSPLQASVFPSVRGKTHPSPRVILR